MMGLLRLHKPAELRDPRPASTAQRAATRPIAERSARAELKPPPVGTSGPVPGEPLFAERVLSLQHSIGNRAVQRYLARTRVVQREDDPPESNGASSTAVLSNTASSLGAANGSAIATPSPSATWNASGGPINGSAAAGGPLGPDIGSIAAAVASSVASGIISPNGSTAGGGAAGPPAVGQAPGPGQVGPGNQTAAPGAAPVAAPGATPGGAALAIPQGQDFSRAATVIRSFAGVVSANTRIAVKKRTLARAAYNRAKKHWNVEAADSGLLAATEAEKAATAAKAARDQLQDKARWLQQFSIAHGILSKAPVKVRTAHWDDLQYASKAGDKLQPLEAAATEAEGFAKSALKPLQLPKSGPTAIIGLLQQKLNRTRAAGPRLIVHGVFTQDTDTALRAFQGAAALTVTGTADVATWTALNTKAPSEVRNLDLVVESKDTAKETKPLNDKIHPELKKGSRGAGVREMQQRLNNWVAEWRGPGPAPYKPFRMNGYFGSTDRKALEAFQRGHGLPASGVADTATWVQLDAVGGVTTGTREFDWTENVEGVSNVGTTARYNWEVKGDAVTITVKIKFTGASMHPMVNTWLKDIGEVWNAYKAVEVGKPHPREYKIEFKPEKSSSGWHKVRVRRPKKGESDRSDSANWYVTDHDRGLAPHEFGHLIGLEDEYNRPEEESVVASGLEPTIGAVKGGSRKKPRQIADELRAVITANATRTPAKQIRKIRKKVEEHGLQPGVFSRAVEAEFKAAHGFTIGTKTYDNLSMYFGAIAGDKFDEDLSAAVAPFLISNKSLMGEMQSVGSRSTNLNVLDAHSHPVQPRHVRAFANLIAQSFPGTKWEPKRR